MLVHKGKKALILRVRDPAMVTTVIPMAKVITYKGHELVVVPHTMDVVKVLRNMGMKAPAPIRYYYEWPGRYKPFAAQESTAAFLTMNPRAFCLNEIGTGKSMSTLWAYDYLRSIGRVNKLLVVSPLSTLERTWGDEIFHNFVHLNYSVLHGSRDKRLKLLNQDVDVYVINHDGVQVIADELAKRPDIDLVVVDEISQVARNASTDRWKALNLVINKQSQRGAWGLTGTPTPNQPTDAWAQARLLIPDSVPKYASRFRDQVMRQVGPYTWIPRDNALDTVRDVMQPAIRFTRDECIDLPPCMYETREIELTAEQKKAYKEMLDNLHTEYGDGQVTAVNEAVKVSKLLQIVCGVTYGNNGEEISIPSNSRLAAVQEVIEEAGAKVIVFVPFVSAVNKVAQYLTSKHISVECIHGGVTKSERDRIFKGFQSGKEPQVLVAQPAAMSHGLTLTAANTIVWFAPHFSNEVFTQANGRITRPGQKNNQFIVMLEGSPVERKLYDRLRNKQKVEGLLLDLIKQEGVLA
jgi:SNF2 family DNA or RNA helicase